MSRYVTQGKYFARRDGQTYGPWEQGTVVVLEPADAEWVNRDSPGVLSPEEVEQHPAEETESEQEELDEGTDDNASAEDEGDEEKAAPAKAAKPRQNRKHTPARTRS